LFQQPFGIADEWVTQVLQQRDTKAFKKYSQMKTADEARGFGKVKPIARKRRLRPQQLRGSGLESIKR
jgi:hypothetical protein